MILFFVEIRCILLQFLCDMNNDQQHGLEQQYAQNQTQILQDGRARAAIPSRADIADRTRTRLLESDDVFPSWRVREGQLFREGHGLCRAQFLPGETNPFSTGREADDVLIGPAGNTFIHDYDFGRFSYLILKPRKPVPETTIAVTKRGLDSFAIDVTLADIAPLSYMWSIDGGQWNAPGKDPQLSLAHLRSGTHHVSIVAFDRFLQTDLTPAQVALDVTLDPDTQIANWIAAFASEDYDDRNAAWHALVRQAEHSLAPLEDARKQADDDLRWWLDATVEQIQRNQRRQSENERSALERVPATKEN